MNQQVFHSDKELAARYRVTRQTIWRWVREGVMPAPLRIGKAATRWEDAAIQKWEQSKRGAAA